MCSYYYEFNFYSTPLSLFCKTKNPSISWGHPKNYNKNMKKAASRIRKLLAYLYYTKKSRPETDLSGAVMLFIFDCVSNVFKRYL